MCTDEMPREKLLTKGAEALSNTELLAILLRTGRDGKNVIDVAREMLIGGGGTLAGLSEMSVERLCDIDGIGPGKAVSIAAAFEIGRRTASDYTSAGQLQIASPKDILRMLQPHVRHLDHEECWVIFLNRANRLIAKERMSIGGQDSTIIDNKAIIRKAIEKKASAIILVHNHPSGNAMPSAADIRQTEMLGKALKTCDLALLDHIIISKDSSYSFADEEMCG